MLRASSWLLPALFCVAGTNVAAQDATNLTDARIAHILYTAARSEVAAAELALNRSSNPAVKGFAEATLRDFGGASEAVLSSFAALNVSPEDNPISQSLSGAAAEQARDLAKTSGAAFDEAYAKNELAYHALIVGALETTLVPSAQSVQVKVLLQSELDLFKRRRGAAAQLARQLK